MERWVDVHGHPNYQVSDKGRVKRISHIAQHKLYGDRYLSERMLSPRINHDGYPRVKIQNKLKFVHVLVLESFVCPRPAGMQACHNNGNSADSRLENLRWDTPKNNVQDRKKHGTYQYVPNNPNFKNGKSTQTIKRIKKMQAQENRKSREEVSQNGQVHSKDREHIVELVNMSLKDLWELAYQEGYKDGMSFVSDEEILKTVAY